MPKILRAVLIPVLLFFWSLPAVVAAANPGGSSSAVQPAQEWEGHISQQEEEFIKVVVTPEEWTALWKRAFDQPAPAVDFAHHAVACVFLGYSATWLYSIGFGPPRERGDVLVIPYGLAQIILELRGPFKASGQYHMKVFEKRPGYRLELEKEFHER